MSQSLVLLMDKGGGSREAFSPYIQIFSLYFSILSVCFHRKKVTLQ
jgi:hypothetical protein